MMKRKLGAACFALAVICLCLAGTLLHVSAADSGTLTLWCAKDDDVVVGMHWQIYRVGYRVDNDYVFEGDFADCRATLGDRSKPMLEWDTETVADAGETLRIETVVRKIPFRAEGYTDDAGRVSFGGLEDGLYLVWGDILHIGDTTYIPSAIFFEMRGEDTAVLNAYPKIVLRTQRAELADYEVRKVWENDEAQPWDRSVYIIAERYRDNVKYDEITLNAENGWSYTWEDTLEHTWFVHEKVIPPHYTVAYQNNFTQYKIVNTYAEDETVSTDTTTVPTETGTTATTAFADTTSAPATSERTSPPPGTTPPPPPSGTVTTTVSEEKVPQTGQLWWPVPLLALGGVLLLGLGFRLTKKDEAE